MKGDILEYLWRRFPNHCIVLTDPGTRRAIDLGIKRAAVNRFTEIEHACSWIVLMVFFGSYFDEDPLHPWAAKAIEETRGLERADAMEVLFARMNEATNPIVGESAVLYREALARVGRLRFETFLRDTDDDLHQSMARWLRVAFPSKFQSLSPDALESLIGTSQEWASRYGLLDRSGSILCMLLIVLFGSHVDRDPLNPWVSAALRNSGITDPMEKTRAMHDSLQTVYLRFAALDRFVGAGS